MRYGFLLLVSCAANLAAQQPRQLTADDYARAERYLGATAAPLVTGVSVRPTWLDNGRFWYRTTLPSGSAFFLVDPARRNRVSVFDQARLAGALNTATGGRATGNQLPFQTFDLAKDGRSITVSVERRQWTCDLQTYSCAAKDTVSSALRAPANSRTSPDGKWAAFIRQHN